MMRVAVAEIDRQLRQLKERRDDDLLTMIGCANDAVWCDSEIARLLDLRCDAQCDDE